MKAWRVVGLACIVGLLPALAWAQGASGIAGVVKDGSGAIIPGVTVEASSPALIEKVGASSPIVKGSTKSWTCVPAPTR